MASRALFRLFEMTIQALSIRLVFIRSSVFEAFKIAYNKEMTVCSPKVRHLRYEALRRSLEETISSWPTLYQHKIIGKNGEDFIQSLKEFEHEFPRLNKLHNTESRNGTYLALTYEVLARDVDEIIALWVASENLKNCIKVM